MTSSIPHRKPIVIVGAGLTGCFAALLFAKRFTDEKFIILEGRDDYRKDLEKIKKLSLEEQYYILENMKNDTFGQYDNAGSRSINLGLSYRGICSLKKAGIWDEILSHSLLVLMKGRYIHNVNNSISIQPYGKKSDDGIYSVSRLALNCLLIDLLESIKNVELRFLNKLIEINKNGVLTIRNNKNNDTNCNIDNDNDYNIYRLESKFILGCDGIYSATRSSLQRLGRYNYSFKYIEHGYKELTILPTISKDKNNKYKSSFAMSENYLHLWPRNDYLLLGTPNPDKSFTCTLFAPWGDTKNEKGKAKGKGKGLEYLDKYATKKEIEMYFNKNFSDFVELCPNFYHFWCKNPASPLGYVNISKYNFQDKILLLGDAAHATVPFYGQGMNCAFEDCLILVELFDKYINLNCKSISNNYNKDIIQNVFNQFSEKRQASCDGLSRLSLQNYIEMRSLTGKKWFIYKKKLENIFNYIAPNMWIPIHTMVTFTRMPYNDAIKKAQKQDEFLAVCLVVVSLVVLGCSYVVLLQTM